MMGEAAFRLKLGHVYRQTNGAKHLQRVPKHVQPVLEELMSSLNSELANG